MLLAKGLVCVVLPLAMVGAISYHETSENMPPKSEIVFRIKRLLQILRDRRKYDVERAQEEQEQLRTRSMEERRRRLEELLQENPGLSALIKKSIKRRKEEEAKMLENDPLRRCRPGIFFCRTGDSPDTNEQDVSLKKLSKLDEEITKRRCRPGVFWCQTGDESVDTKRDKIASQNQRKSLELLEAKFKDGSTKDDTKTAFERLFSILGKPEQQDPQGKRRCRPGLFHCAQGDEGNNVEIVRMPVDISKKTEITNSLKADSPRRRCSPGSSHCKSSRDESKSDSKEGERLADDLMESLDNIQKTKSDSPRNEKTSFNIDQIAKILENSKR